MGNESKAELADIGDVSANHGSGVLFYTRWRG